MKIEANSNTLKHVDPHPNVMITPALDEDFWLFRAPLTDKNAIVCLPKFGTIGIGFQHEEDWNTNLPWTCDTKEIFDHIEHNRGDETITEDMCIEAIDEIKGAIERSRAVSSALRKVSASWRSAYLTGEPVGQHQPCSAGDVGEWVYTVSGNSPERVNLVWDERGFLAVPLSRGRQLPIHMMPNDAKWERQND